MHALLLVRALCVGQPPVPPRGLVVPSVRQQIVGWRETSLVRPSLKNMALRQRVFQPTPRVMPQPREQHQIRAARHHVDSVDLQQLHLRNALAQSQRCGGFNRRSEQALRSKM